MNAGRSNRIKNVKDLRSLIKATHKKNLEKNREIRCQESVPFRSGGLEEGGTDGGKRDKEDREVWRSVWVEEKLKKRLAWLFCRRPQEKGFSGGLGEAHGTKLLNGSLGEVLEKKRPYQTGCKKPERARKVEKRGKENSILETKGHKRAESKLLGSGKGKKESPEEEGLKEKR